MSPAPHRLRIAAIEPFFGGSHRLFLEGYQKFSRHRVDLFTLPARKWKWRMRGAALHFAEALRASAASLNSAQGEASEDYDLLFVSDYLSLTDLVALLPRELAAKPRVVYFHENQLTYPFRDESERDYHFAFTNITTCLAADLAVFNSEFHRRSFLEALGPFLRKMPDYQPEGVVRTIEANSRVLHLGVDVASVRALPRPVREGPALILWNHRWEFDKNPEAFFETLITLKDHGLEFRVAVVGEKFREYPQVFDQARDALADRTVAFGHIEDRGDYLRLLRRCDVVVSTAIHEFFGVAVVEAIAAGCWPLLPERLSYPELLPRQMHRRHLYRSQAQLREGLRGACQQIDEIRRQDVSGAADRFAWENLVDSYDRTMREAAGRHPV